MMKPIETSYQGSGGFSSAAANRSRRVRASPTCAAEIDKVETPEDLA
jgi:hypothetical protein